MAKKCAECGEKLKLTNRRWQYIDGVFTEFCSDEHRAAYEGRAALEAQLKPHPPAVEERPVVEKEFPHKDPIRRFFGGQLPLVPSYWIGLWALPVAFFVAYERLLWFYLHPENASWDTGYGYPIFLVFGGR